MGETRRAFLRTVAAGAGVFAGAPFLVAQRSIKPPPQPEPAAKGNPAEANPNWPGGRAANRAQLERAAKEFREGVEQLYRLTGELREEVQKTGTTDVLSMRMYKRAEQIEKLAKQLKNKAKGS
jgi:hypothetical protein